MTARARPTASSTWWLTGALALAATPSLAQDLYDTTVLRTINLQFDDADWLARLRANYVSETLIQADLTIDGVTYPDVGVRIRGNTSYTALPAGSEKFSLKVELDFVHPDQELWGYDELNLNNGFRDPTFTREVVYNNFVAQYVPNPRANHVLLTLNGQNWGVYNNVQHTDKRLLRDYFTNADGLRIRCANTPNGPGLAYAGTNPASYANYVVQADGGLANPLQSLIDTTFVLSNEPLATWRNIDLKFAIDPSIWSVVLENLLTDDDSYVNKGCDFMTYTDPLDGRMHLWQRDANETFTQTTWSITRNFTATNKPVLNRVLAVPELRQRYFAHYRTARANLNWAYFGPRFAAARALIEPHVQADPKKIYTYQNFQDNFASTVTLAPPGLAGGSIIGIQPFVEQRATFLAGSTELSATGPTISAAAATPASPDAAQPVYVTATVAPNGSPIGDVWLHYRAIRSGLYQQVPMADDGQSGDGAAGDGVYGALLPITATSGQRVSWYVRAASANTFQSLSFLPDRAERGPRVLQYTFGATGGMRITEWMYSGVAGEFVEFTNLGSTPIDLTGWSFDDDRALPGSFPLTALGVVQPGASVVITEADAAAFATAWSLPAGSAVLGGLGGVGAPGSNNLGRSDQIHLFNATGELVDVLYFGDQTYPGTIRTQNRSGQAPCASIGQNAVAGWQLSTAGDAYGSVSAVGGDVGSPGRYLPAPCTPPNPRIFDDGFEASGN